MKKIIRIALVAALAIALVASAYAATNTEPPYYMSAVRWAWEQGITNGTTATTFSPDRHVTRAELVTMLWRMAGSPEPHSESPFEDIEPEPTPTPTPHVIPQPPKVEPTIQPDYADCYIGRMYIGDSYSVGLYETLDQALVDMSDAAFMHMVWGDQTYMIGDHDYEGLWLIRYLEAGDEMRIEYADGRTETYAMQGRNPHVRNTGYDVLDADGKSLFNMGYDVFIATCNDSAGKDMTATFWARTDGGVK